MTYYLVLKFQAFDHEIKNIIVKVQNKIEIFSKYCFPLEIDKQLLSKVY